MPNDEAAQDVPDVTDATLASDAAPAKAAATQDISGDEETSDEETRDEAAEDLETESVAAAGKDVADPSDLFAAAPVTAADATNDGSSTGDAPGADDAPAAAGEPAVDETVEVAKSGSDAVAEVAVSKRRKARAASALQPGLFDQPADETDDDEAGQGEPAGAPDLFAATLVSVAPEDTPEPEADLPVEDLPPGVHLPPPAAGRAPSAPLTAGWTSAAAPAADTPARQARGRGLKLTARKRKVALVMMAVTAALGGALIAFGLLAGEGDTDPPSVTTTSTTDATEPDPADTAPTTALAPQVPTVPTTRPRASDGSGDGGSTAPTLPHGSLNPDFGDGSGDGGSTAPTLPHGNLNPDFGDGSGDGGSTAPTLPHGNLNPDFDDGSGDGGSTAPTLPHGNLNPDFG